MNQNNHLTKEKIIKFAKYGVHIQTKNEALEIALQGLEINSAETRSI